MPTALRSSVVRSLVSTTLVALLLLTASSRAEEAGSIAAKPRAAYALLMGRLADPDGAAIPRLSNAADAGHIKAIYNLDAAIAARPAGAQALPELLKWSEAAASTNKAYIYARRAGSSEKIEANIKEFAEEISLGAVFNFRLSVTMHQSGAAFMASLPENDAKSDARQNGWKQMVLGLYQQISGLLLMEFSGTPMIPGSDERAAAALAQDMPIVSQSFNGAQRDALTNQFERSIKVASPQAAAGLATALAALKQGINPQ